MDSSKSGEEFFGTHELGGGHVTEVINATEFYLKATNSQIFRLRLSCLVPPDQRSALGRQANQEAKRHLASLLEAQFVTVDVRHIFPNHRGDGFVHHRDNRINEEMLRAGLLRLDKNEIRTLPFKVQHGLLGAERTARNARKGIWQNASTAD